MRRYAIVRSVSFSSSTCIAAGSRAQELAEVLVLFAAAAFDQVGGERQRRAAEADERDRPAAARRGRGAARRRRTARSRSRSVERFDRSRERSGCAIDGPGVNCDLDAERFERRHDVAEDDRRVERKTAQRLQRDLRGDLRRARHLQERRALFDREVLGQIASGLAHDPNRRPLLRDAADRLKKLIESRSQRGRSRVSSVPSTAGQLRIGPSLMPSALCWTPRRPRPCRDLGEAGASWPP